MRRGRYGGTAGKARKHRERSRADQDYESLLMHDWREPEHTAHRERLIPIRRRSDFLPAVACSSDVEDEAFGTQLDLPLERSATGDRSASSHVVWPPEEAGPVRRSRLTAPVGPLWSSIIQFQPKAGEAARVRTRPAAERGGWFRADYTTRTRRGDQRRAGESATVPRFTLGGFAYGCLLGGAAAAVALVLIDSLL